MEQFPTPHRNEPPRIEFSVEEIEDAREYIKNRWAEGVRPTVTVPKKYLPYLEKGLTPHSTWIPGLEIVAGTFDKKEYIPASSIGEDERVAFSIDVPAENIEPRFTGPRHTFNGVVILRGPIPPESIHTAH